jgi:hypothetical protein
MFPLKKADTVTKYFPGFGMTKVAIVYLLDEA